LHGRRTGCLFLALLGGGDEGQEDFPLRGDVELVVKALAVILYGAAAEAKLVGDGFGGTALRLLREILAQKALDPNRRAEIYQGPEVQSDDAIDA
jgi:hypothetical protein